MVLLGETHVIADHHRWHMQTVAQLYAQRPSMILGFEAFPRRVGLPIVFSSLAIAPIVRPYSRSDFSSGENWA